MSEDNVMPGDVLRRLSATIKARRTAPDQQSYTRRLLDQGSRVCARKFGEEAIELMLAAAGEDDKSVASEAADVIYHLLVLLESRAVEFDAVLAILDSRTAQSGLAEKAARPT